ncbi:trimethyllysine dioxygenase [Metarhizium album ARSEF 1941]|uniref:Trimethyllysine dioxygenase n=1 Tax=Metarhizium album (strain ARSEF 1941) TaxID=1081103 RepID=A0A0B2X7C5_METAS|nr:trimethyllysine dioxygenase [Metarhizium album ARSEF 1941]KHO01400.1 trimethyllysine dioxygenase [Metarhizium album ARSEF 1941]
MAVSSSHAIRAWRLVAGRGPGMSRRAPLVQQHAFRGYATTLESDDKGLILKVSDGGSPSLKRLSQFWLRTAGFFRADHWPKGSDSHQSSYTWSWLRTALSGVENKKLKGPTKQTLWNASIASNPPEVSFDSVMAKGDSSGMADLTEKIHDYGLCFVTNTPVTPEATNELLEAIGPIRNTHYGGFYDFIPDLAKADTAYTNLALAAHTDTTYFTEPAGLQAFHMLSHTPPPNRLNDDGSLGGKSFLVDGFYAAHRLKKEFPESYEILRAVRLPWHASGNEGVAITPDRAYPVIEASPYRIHRVRWNNDDRGVVPATMDVDKWYSAARNWDRILRRKYNEYWFQLEPGRVLIFDNWRILHGRSAFEGLRRICGGYINRDDFISRWKTSNFPSSEVIAANMQLK